MKLFTPTLPVKGMSVQLAAKAAQLNAITLHASIRCFSTNAGGEAKYWLPLKWGGDKRDAKIRIPSPLRVGSKPSAYTSSAISIPSPCRGRVRACPVLDTGVGVQYLHHLNTAKLFVTCLTALLVSVFTMPLQAAPDDDFGRLFSRQNERKNLDFLRKNQKLKVITPQDLQPDPLVSAAPPELPDPITLQGYVKRSDGASTLWINNQAVQEDSAIDNVQIGRLKGQQNKAGAGSDSLNVKIPANGKQVRLKAGQVYMPETNQIVELKTVEKAKRLNFEETGVIYDGVIE
ncbi:MAG: hypothetical protein Q8Q76_00935 [Methylotenera sp.]|nr:hypothetical protein [Methylotenera sp.]